MSARPVLLPLRFGRRKLKKVVLFLILCLLVGTYFTVRSAPKDSEQHPFHSDQKNAVSNPFDRRGIRVVIGYYTGDDEIKKGENLSKAELNANSYSPVPGVGENGIPVVIPFHETNKMTRLFSINQFNLMASDRISVDRKLPDVRKKRCREKVYPPFSSLPSTSVVIVFHNEAWSTLLRTVHSVINRSPKELLHEIILVDDASERGLQFLGSIIPEFLGESLEAYIAGLSVPTRVLRLPSRQGLVKARLFGAQEASGAVLTFLDAHCETTDGTKSSFSWKKGFIRHSILMHELNSSKILSHRPTGWLEPLLFTVSEDRRNVVSPIIDIIDDKTFAYVKSLELHWGGFNWNMHFRWYSIGQAAMDERKRDPTAAFRSPVMAGGLFSIDRKYFYEMGSYDEDMDIWGGENIEMSLRVRHLY
ncbi:unnamed protein product [Cyprideis torosa]|uniref:Uncharacterized protein n=1 Tax=Cyprideis torosa TaxID=163714 RepID=A0A7R8WA91_9CRUS|nr:unnamed protein product [Cyprideis torosa]CAG0890733.1 unnamed protein product [Cyprideis torosa]